LNPHCLLRSFARPCDLCGKTNTESAKKQSSRKVSKSELHKFEHLQFIKKSANICVDLQFLIWPDRYF